jgi:acyl phosphate:glycerol-3-phosphate acyltransferase
MTIWLLCMLGAYLCGSVPFGVIIARAKGVDIRQAGSRNIGATNVGRVLGKNLGMLCFALDVAKGAIPVAAAGMVMHTFDVRINDLSSRQMWQWLAIALAAVLGHMYSIFIGFAGGKGVATAFGAMVAMWPLLTFPALAAMVVWYAVLRVTKYVSLASMVAAAAIPVGVLLTALPNDASNALSHLQHAAPLLIVTVALALLVIYKHRGNIARLRRGEEPKAGGNARRDNIVEHNR